MKLIELHILQSFPVSCLNRDDVGAPKSAVFGGVTRARISSQCLKRATREEMRRQADASGLVTDRFRGKRTKRLVKDLADAMHSAQSEQIRVTLAELIAGQLSKLTLDRDETGQRLVSTLTYLTPCEVEAIGQSINAKAQLYQLAAALTQAENALRQSEQEEGRKIKEADKEGKKKLEEAWGKKEKALEKGREEARRECADAMLGKDAIGTAIRSVHLKDGADIAIFGRMIASDPSLTVEGAAMFSHALSTHRADNDIDFFSALDDAKPKGGDLGAGMIGTVEFNAPVYYRYAAINLDLLADKNHIGEPAMSAEQRQAVVDAFLRAVILAVPTARHNAMNAHTRPAYVLGTYKKSGQPVQLVNAFESPISSRNGLVGPSCRELLLHRNSVNSAFGVVEEAIAAGWYRPSPDSEEKLSKVPLGDGEAEQQTLTKAMIPDQLNLDDFCEKLIAHVI